MARKPQEFNQKQNDMLDDVKALAMDADAAARHGMESIANGDPNTAFLDFGDIRNILLQQRDKVGRAQRGEYDK